MPATLTDHGVGGGSGVSALTAPVAWTPTAGNVVVAIIFQNNNSALTVPTPWGTWQKLLSLSAGGAADGGGYYWDVHAVVVGASPTSAAPSVGQPSVCTGTANFIEISGLDTSSLASLMVQWNHASKASTSGDSTMATTLSTFASASNLCLALKYGWASQPWTAVSPLTILANNTNTGASDYTANAYYNGQDLAPEIDGSQPGNNMGIIAMELKVASAAASQPGQLSVTVPFGSAIWPLMGLGAIIRRRNKLAGR